MASTCEKVAVFLLVFAAGYLGGRYLFGKSGAKSAPLSTPVDLGFAKTVADALATQRGLKPAASGEQGKVDRHRYFFLFRRARDLGLADAQLRSGAGLQTLQKRVDGQATQVEKQLAAWLGDATRRGPYFGADTTFAGRARHLDLGAKVRTKVVDAPATTESDAVHAQTPTEAQARTLRELDLRKAQVTGIVWRAAAIDPDLWQGSGDAVQLKTAALGQLLDRRLRAAERLRYEVSAGATTAGVGSAFDRVWSSAATIPPSATQGPWTDRYLARAFEAPSIARSTASDDGSWVVEQVFGRILSVSRNLTLFGDITGGRFTLEYASDATGAIAFDATTDQVRDAIAALPSLGGLTVKCRGGRLPEGTVEITLDGEPGAGDELKVGAANQLVGANNPAPALSAKDIRRAAELEPKPRFNARGGSSPWYLDRPTDEFDWNTWPGTRIVGKSWSLAPDPLGGRTYGWVLMPAHDLQSLDVGGAPTGGTFKLRFDGAVTRDLAPRTSAEDVKAALAALPGGGPKVIVDGGPLPFSPVLIRFHEVGLAEPKLEVAANDLTGGTNPQPSLGPRTAADVLSPSAAIEELFALLVTPADGTPAFDRLDWWNRSWLHSDGMMAALHLESLHLGLMRQAIAAAAPPEDEFDDLPWRNTVVLDDCFDVRGLQPAADGIMKRGRTDYFENAAIELGDVQIGDQVLFATAPPLVALGATIADYPTLLVTGVDTSLNGADVNAAGLELQGFNSARLDHATLQTLFVKKADAALKAAQDYVTAEVARQRAQAAAAGRPFTPPKQLPWDIGVFDEAEDFHNDSAVLRLWSPYGDPWDDPGPWWIWINLFGGVWKLAFGSDGGAALPRVPGAVRWDESAKTVELSNHSNPWRKANAPSVLGTGSGFQPPPFADATQTSVGPGDVIFVPLFQPTGGWEAYFETKVQRPADSAWPSKLDPVRADSRWVRGLAGSSPDASDVRVIRPRVKPTV